jgi:uncharacterized membrane protein
MTAAVFSVFSVDGPSAGRAFDGSVLVRSALVGAVSGARSQLGVAATALTTPAGCRRQPAALLSGRTAKVVAAVAAVGELVGDKLPATPSRLTAAGLVPRALLGAFAAAALASRPAGGPPWRENDDEAVGAPADDRTALDAASFHAAPGLDAEPEPWSRTTAREPDRPPVPDAAALIPAALLGAAAAVAASYAGAAWRRTAARSLGSDWPGALLEDAVAATLAWFACATNAEPHD